MDAIYSLDVESTDVRIERIENQKENSDRTFPFQYFQNKPHNLPVVRLPIGLPIYRMANYRTRAVQLAYIRQNSKQNNFFSNGQENVTAQRIQHKLLFTFAQKGVGDSVIPIKDVLESDRQHEPLLITSDGVVVNGNRRLSAMRELYSTGMGQYGHVDCMVLPAYATADELKEIEIKLQMTPHTLLPYDWVCEGIAVKELLSNGMLKDNVSKLMRKRPSDIDNQIMALEQAELYLAEREGAPGDYSKVEDKEQMFFDIARNLKSKSGEDFEASRNIAFILTENAGDLGTRVYDFKGSFGTYSTQVIERLARRYELDLTQVPEDDVNQVELEFDFEDEDEDEDENGPVRSYRPVINLLEDKTQSVQLVEDIIDIYKSIRDEEGDQAAGQSALNKIKQANTRLIEADISRAEQSTYRGISQQIAAIKQRLEQLENELAIVMTAGASE